MPIILGLGSNVGNRLAYLRQAVSALRMLPTCTVEQVSPLYLSEALLPPQAPLSWDKPYLNLAVAVQTALKPLSLLAALQQIEATILGSHLAERKENHWGPRKIDIDILAWDDLCHKQESCLIPHPALLTRPFALWPLADIAPFWQYPLPGQYYGRTAAELVEPWGSRFTGKAIHQTRQLPHRLDPPHLIGILNVTPDSFSDGNEFLQPERALQQALALVAAGAEIIDIGAASTAPQAVSTSPMTEWRRLEPVFALIRQTSFILEPIISLDTHHVSVAEQALRYQPHWINDVSGLDDPAMRAFLKAHEELSCVIMHHLCIPENRQERLPRHLDPLNSVYTWAQQRLALLNRAGITSQRIIFDPGIGFGKTAEQSYALLQKIDYLTQLGVRLLVGHSRKSFLSLFTAATSKDSDIETMALSLALAKHPVDFLRVHQVDMHARALKMLLNN